MAISRYDQRKNYEEAEANAIGTEYVPAGPLPQADAPKFRDLLRKYIEQRVLFYTAHDEQNFSRSKPIPRNCKASFVHCSGRRTCPAEPRVALSVAGINGVINAQGSTQASWSNRIPIAAWGLMAAIAVFCNLLLGYVSHKSGSLLFLALTLAVSVSFFLIAEIDSPRVASFGYCRTI